MFIAKKLLETNAGVFRRGAEVPADIAARYSRDVEEVVTEVVEAKPAKAKKAKKEEIVEEILTEDSSDVSVDEE